MGSKFNRLHLDFSIESDIDRKNFIDKYILQDEFTTRPLTESELETISNYILWGKDSNGENFVQRGDGDIDTRFKTWTTDNVESLDALLEDPAFNESTINNTPSQSHKTKVTPTKFNREEALREAPPHLTETLNNLFRSIDTMDLQIELYQLDHGIRTKEIRTELLSKFTPEEIEKLHEQTTHWTQFYYLKQRHFLVERRNEQYTIRDSYKSQISNHMAFYFTEQVNHLSFDNLTVMPLGLKTNYAVKQHIFEDFKVFNPYQYKEDQLREVSDYYWRQKNLEQNKGTIYFDFREKEHIYQLFLQFYDIKDEVEGRESELEVAPDFLDTLKFYIEMAELEPIYMDLLRMKMEHKTNSEISKYLGAVYGKSYGVNYISTIFRQKIIPQINKAAELHLSIIENMYFPENFKKCSTCGRWLLRDNEHFIRKSRSSDGLSARCKRCDKAVREAKKVK